MTSQRKLDMVGTWSTIQKRAKRMPDIIVATTVFWVDEVMAKKMFYIQIACLFNRTI